MNNNHSRIRQRQKKKSKGKALQADSEPKSFPSPKKKRRGRPRKNSTQQSSSGLTVNTDLVELPHGLDSKIKLLRKPTIKKAPKPQTLNSARANASSLVPIGRATTSKNDTGMRTKFNTLHRIDKVKPVRKTRRADIYTFIE